MSFLDTVRRLGWVSVFKTKVFMLANGQFVVVMGGFRF